MSRQNKQIKQAKRAEMFNNGGPKSTTPKHGKNPANRVYTKRCRSMEEFSGRNKPKKTASKALAA